MSAFRRRQRRGRAIVVWSLLSFAAVQAILAVIIEFWAPVRRDSARSRDQTFRWLRARLTPAWHHRYTLMSRLMPNWLPWNESRQDSWIQLDRSGWMPYGKREVTAEEHRKGIAEAWRQYEH